MCQRSRRARRCTDSSLHAGRLLFTKEKAALVFHWLLIVTRLQHHGAFTGQRDDSNEDYIYQPVSSGVNCASTWAEPRVSGVSPFSFLSIAVDVKHNKNKGEMQKLFNICEASGRCWIERCDITPGREGLLGFKAEAGRRSRC